MKSHRKWILFPLSAAFALLSGCSTLPMGYSQRDWKALSTAEQERLRQMEFKASDEMHRALARDAATENGFVHNSRYGPW